MDPIDYNFMHSIATLAVTSKTGQAFENRDLLLTSTGAPIAEFNQAFLKRPSYKLERALAQVLDHYARLGVPFRLQFSSEHASVAAELESRSFTRSESIPGMMLSQPLGAQHSAPELDVQQVTDATLLADFQRTAFEGFGFPPALAPLALTEDLMRLPHVALFVGYVGGEPACTSALLVTGDMAGIHWVGTREPYRRRGLGAAITARAVQAGLERGCRRASLQASAMGAPVYRRMGFVMAREYLRFDFFRNAG